MKHPSLLPLLLLLAALPAPAGTRTWDGGDASGNLMASLNWNPNSVPLAGDELYFPAGVNPADKTVNNNFPANTTFDRLRIFDGGYTLGGVIMKLTNGVQADFPAGTATINAGLSLLDNTTISAANGAALHFGGASQIYGAPGSILKLTSATASSITVDGLLTGGSELYLEGPGAITLNGAKNTNTPVMIWQAANVTINDSLSLGPASGGLVSLQNTLRLNALAPQTLQRPFLMGNNAGGDTQLISQGGNHTLSGPVAFTGASIKFIEVPSGTLTLSGVLSSAPGHAEKVIKRGPGTLRLTGTNANTFTNLFRIEEGTVDLAKTGVATPAFGGQYFQIGNSDGAPGSARAVILDNFQLGNEPFVGVYSDGVLDLTNNLESIGSLLIEGPGSVTGAPDGLGLMIYGDLSVTGDPGAAPATISGNLIHPAGDHLWTVNDFSAGSDLVCIADLLNSPNARITFDGTGEAEIYAQCDLERITLEGPGALSGGIDGMNTDLYMHGGRLGASVGVRHLDCNDGILDPGMGIEHYMLTCKTCTLGGTALYRYSLQSPEQHDIIVAEESVTLNNPLMTVITPPNVPYKPGDEYLMITNLGDNPVNGEFVFHPEGSMYLTNFFVSYKGGDGNDVSLTWILPSTGVTRIWDGGGADNNWTTAANWAGNILPQPGDTLLFPAVAQRKTNTNDFPAGTVFHSITIGEGSYNIGGNRIMLNEGLHFAHAGGSPIWNAPLVFALPGSITAASAGALVNALVDFGNNPTTLHKNNGPGELVCAGGLTGAIHCSLHKTGTGTVRLTQAADFEGGAYVEEGRLTVSHQNALNPAYGWTQVSEDAELRLDGAGAPLNMGDTISLRGTCVVAAGPACSHSGAIIPEGNAALLRTDGDLIVTGALNGPGTLHKSGTGILTLADNALNDAAGGLYIDEGEVRVAMAMQDAMITSPIVIGNAGLAARLTLAGADKLGDDVEIQVLPTGTFDAGIFPETFGTLTMTGGNVTGTGALPLTLKSGILTTQAAATPATISARIATPAAVNGRLIIAEGPASPDLTIQNRVYGSIFEKSGPGRVDFTANQPVDAFDTLDIQEGSALFFSNSQHTAILLNGGTLGGHGTVGEIKSMTGGLISPGASPGVLGGYKAAWNGATTLHMELSGLNPGAEYDQYSANGLLDLGSAHLTLKTGFDPAPGDSFMIIRNVSGAPVAGTFAGIPQNGYVSAPGAKVFRINYTGGDGDDVVLTYVDVAPPEIVTYTMTPGPNPGDEAAAHFVFKGTPGLLYSFEVSTDLKNWQPLKNAVADLLTGQIVIDLVEPAGDPRKFYQLRLP